VPTKSADTNIQYIHTYTIYLKNAMQRHDVSLHLFEVLAVVISVAACIATHTHTHIQEKGNNKSTTEIHLYIRAGLPFRVEVFCDLSQSTNFNFVAEASTKSPTMLSRTRRSSRFIFF